MRYVLEVSPLGCANAYSGKRGSVGADVGSFLFQHPNLPKPSGNFATCRVSVCTRNTDVYTCSDRDTTGIPKVEHLSYQTVENVKIKYTHSDTKNN
jgi:hypothetical protein